MWGGVDPGGGPFLHPAFVVDAPAALPDSAGDYTVTGRNAAGADLFSLSFTMPEVVSEEEEVGSFFAFVLPLQPEWAGNLGSITLAGPGGLVTLDEATDRPMAILRDPRTGQVRGFLSDFPPGRPAQVAADAASAGVAPPGLEVLFSRGIPDAATWNR